MKYMTCASRLAGLLGAVLIQGINVEAQSPSPNIVKPPGGVAAVSSPSSSGPLFGVYRGPLAAPAVEAYEKWIGKPVSLGVEFAATDSWDKIEGPNWLLSPWAKWVKAQPGRRLMLSVPLLPGPWNGSGPTQGKGANEPVSLEKGAQGAFNAHFAELAKNLVAQGLGDSWLRLGWEFNGGWYTWRAGGKDQAYAEYWRQIVKTMRAVPGAQGLKFVWNPALGYLGLPSEKAWPGDEFVDFVGIDIYDDSWVHDTYPWPDGTTPDAITARQKKTWQEALLNGNHGLAFWKKFAAEHHKPLGFPEWGVDNRKDKHGGMDDTHYVEQMHAFISDPKNNVAFHCYFDFQAPDGHHQLSPGANGAPTEFPEASAKFAELFGKPAK